MTSNMGAHIIQENFEKLTDKNKDKIVEETKNQVFELLRKSIRPEFLNRIDETIMFQPLSRKDVLQIVKIQFGMLAKRLKETDIEIEATDEALEWLALEGYDPQFGARPVKRVMQRDLLNQLSKSILAGTVVPGSKILLDLKDGKLDFENVNNEATSK